MHSVKKSAVRVGETHHIAVGDGGGGRGYHIVAVVEGGGDGGICVVRGEHLNCDALGNVAVAEGRGLCRDGEDEAAVGVGADGAVGNNGVVIGALLSDGDGKLRAGGDIALQIKGEGLVCHGVFLVGLNCGEGRGYGVAPIIVAYRRGVADVQALCLVIRDREADGVPLVGHFDRGENIVLYDDVARRAVDLRHRAGDVGGDGVGIPLAAPAGALSCWRCR